MFPCYPGMDADVDADEVTHAVMAGVLTVTISPSQEVFRDTEFLDVTETRDISGTSTFTLTSNVFVGGVFVGVTHQFDMNQVIAEGGRGEALRRLGVPGDPVVALLQIQCNCSELCRVEVDKRLKGAGTGLPGSILENISGYFFFSSISAGCLLGEEHI